MTLQRIQNIGWIVGMILAAGFAAMTGFGCASFNAAANAAKFEQSHGALTEDLVAAMNDIVAVLPGTAGEPRVHLLDAQNFIKAAQGNAVKEQESFTTLTTKYTDAVALVKSLEESWLSYRQKHEILYSVLIVLGCVVGYVVLMILLNSAAPLSALKGLAGFIGTAAKWLFHILSVGFVALAKKINTAVAAKVATKQPPLKMDIVAKSVPGGANAPLGAI